MRHTVITILLTGALLIPTSAAGAPAGASAGAPAGAAAPVTATLQFEPTSGRPDDVVTVTGTEWYADSVGDVSIFLQETGAEPTASENLVLSATPDENGTISATYPVPDLEPGAYTYYACQDCSNPYDGPAAEARAVFTVTEAQVLDPSLTLTPVAAPVGESVLAEGVGWSDELGEVTLYTLTTEPEGVVQLATAPVTEGAFQADFAVPDLPLGPREILSCQACDAVKDVLAAPPAPFTVSPPPVVVEPALSLLPEAGAPGARITASGIGWNDAAGEVSLYASRSDLEDGLAPLARFRTTGGTFEEPVTVPAREAGDYTWLACQLCGDPKGLTDEAAFTIQTGAQPNPDPSPQPSPEPGDQTLSLRPTAATPGTTVAAQGSGWDPAGPDVLVFLDASESTDPENALLTAPALSDGTFEGTLVLPDEEPATLTVYACQVCGSAGALAATASFELLDATALDPLAGRSSWPAQLTTALVVLVLLVLAALVQQWRRRTRLTSRPSAPTPSLLLHPDLSFDVAHVGPATGDLPTLRLVPRPDETDPHRVEMR